MAPDLRGSWHQTYEVHDTRLTWFMAPDLLGSWHQTYEVHGTRLTWFMSPDLRGSWHQIYVVHGTGLTWYIAPDLLGSWHQTYVVHGTGLTGYIAPNFNISVTLETLKLVRGITYWLIYFVSLFNSITWDKWKPWKMIWHVHDIYSAVSWHTL